MDPRELRQLGAVRLPLDSRLQRVADGLGDGEGVIGAGGEERRGSGLPSDIWGTQQRFFSQRSVTKVQSGSIFEGEVVQRRVLRVLCLLWGEELGLEMLAERRFRLGRPGPGSGVGRPILP